MQTNRLRSARGKGRPAAAALAALLLSAVPALAGNNGAPRHRPRDHAHLFTTRGLAPVLRRENGTSRVVISLRQNPLSEAALAPKNRVALTSRTSETAQRLLRTHSIIGEHLAYHSVRKRSLALAGLDGAAIATEQSQRSLLAAIRLSDGRAIGRNLLTNSITAVVPARALPELAARSDVQAIAPAPVDRTQGLIDASTAVGAPSFWSAGYTGGNGTSDTSPIDLAVSADKIQEDHPAFAGLLFQRPPGVGLGTACGSSAGSCDHGTAVASAAISRGASGCAQCIADDANQKGVAPGLHSVLDAATDGTSLPSEFDMVSWEHGIASGGLPGATYPAQIISDSHGGTITTDDNSDVRGTDAVTSQYGDLLTEPAGNEGPGTGTVDDQCIAYDSLCMGAFDAGTSPSDPSDDTILDFSSRGPSPGGRKKPDLVGVGDPTYARRLWWISGNGLWDAHLTGTSFASPQAAGAAALLAGSGVTDPLAEKAILINAARQGRATPASPMGTQTGWQPDWGWGELDLADALARRTNFASATVPSYGARFYRATTSATGDRATLVWNRRGTMCRQPGCTANVLTLTNLDLEQLDPATGAVEAQSNSTIDNVEQVRSPAAGPVIYKVRSTSDVYGLSAEPYAIAATNALTPLVTPQPTVTVSASATQLRPGQTAIVTATATNPSPDLTGENAELTLDLPGGLTLDSGAQTQTVGTLAQNGQAGDTATRTWTVRATADTAVPMTVTATTSRYGETFTSQAREPIVVDGTAPSVTLAAPSGQTTNPALPVSWSATDGGSGVAYYELEVSVDGAAFSSWIGPTLETHAVYTGQAGHAYRFRVRATDELGNLSDYVASNGISVMSAVSPPPPAGSGSGSSTPPPRLALAFNSVVRRGSRVTVRGTLNRLAAGRIALTYQSRIGRRTYRAQVRAVPHLGRFAARIRLSRTLRRARIGRLTATYAGDAVFSREVRHLVVKRS